MEIVRPWPYGLDWEASDTSCPFVPSPFVRDLFELHFLKPSIVYNIVYILSEIFCTYVGDSVVYM